MGVNTFVFGGGTALILLVIQVMLTYFLSRMVTNEMFFFLRLFTRDETLVFIFITLLFLPGTIVHELSHFLAATILMLRVRGVTIFPKRGEHDIKLGSVMYEKKDVVRGLLVGIAPIFGGLSFFWFLSRFTSYPHMNFFLTAIITYLVFTVASTMFSSQKDLVDLIFVIPITIIVISIIYIANIDLGRLIWGNSFIIHGLYEFVERINSYLFISLIVNLFLLGVFKSVQFIFVR